MRYSITNNPNVRVFILEEIIRDFKGYIAGFGTSNKLVDNLFDTDSKLIFGELSQGGNQSSLISESKSIDSVYKILDSPSGCHFTSDYYQNKNLYKNYNLNESEYLEFAKNVSFLFPSKDDTVLPFSSYENHIDIEGFSGGKSGTIIASTLISEYDLDFQNYGKDILLEIAKKKKEKDSPENTASIAKLENEINQNIRKELVRQPVNTNIPDANNPTCSAIVIRNNNVNFQGRNKNFFNFFLNAIPPLEMSRCTPYLDIIFFNKEKNKNYMNNAIHMKFVKQEDGNMVLDDNSKMTLVKRFENIIKEKDTQATYMTAFTSPQTMANANINNESFYSAGDKLEDLFSTSVLNYKEKYLEPIVPLMTLGGFNVAIQGMGFGTTASRRGSLDLIIHDRSRIKMFAPLISLSQQANTFVRVEFGWSHPDGDPVKSENVFGKFLNANRDVQYYIMNGTNMTFNNNSIQVNISLAASGGENAIAISAAAGYYIPLNYITRQINESIDRVLSKNNVTKKTQPNVLEKMTIVKSRAGSLMSLVLTQDYQELLNKLNNSEDFKVLKLIMKMTKIVNPEDPDFLNANTFQELSKVIQKTKSDPDYYKKLGYSAYGIIKNKLRILKQNITIDENKKHIYDPFIADPQKTMIKGAIPQVHHAFAQNIPEVSLGSLIFQYVVSPMMATHRYSEVQTIFYPINDKAAGARKYTTASITLPVTAIEKAIEEISETAGQLSVRGMFSLLTNLFDDRNLPVYGISNLDNYKEELVKSLGEEELSNKAKNTFTAEYGREPDEKELNAAVTEYISIERKSKLENELSSIYNNDGLGAVGNLDFVKPDILIYFETIPVLESDFVKREKPDSIGESIVNSIKDFGNFLTSDTESEYTSSYFGQEKILRIHVYDREATSNPQTRFLNDIINDNELSTFAGNLKGVHEKLGGKIKSFKDVGGFINNIPIGIMKQFIKRNYPSITWGAMNSTVKSISVSSNTSDKISQQIMIRKIHEEKTGNVSKFNQSAQEEVQINPSTMSVQLFGCPFLNRGNEIFVDMGTNTDLDNIYFVNSLTHVIKSGEFSTSLNLNLIGQGRITSTRNQLAKKIQTLDIAVKESEVQIKDDID